MSSPPEQSDLTAAIVNLDAISANARALSAHLSPPAKLIAVVKANAYGHGAEQVARIALENGAASLAVARVNEGVALRQAGITAPILVMGAFMAGDAADIVTHDLTATPNNIDTAQALNAAAQGKRVRIHLKIDTGMGRYGLLPDEMLPFAAQIAALEHLEWEGLFSHFAVADLRDKAYTRQQFDTFMQVSTALQEAGYSIPIRHIANSAATLDLPEMHLDAVRTGIALYGLHPSDEVTPAVPLQAALTLKSRVARLRTLPTGSSISYGRTYITDRPTKVALVPVGYGDGYPRNLSNIGQVLIGGERATIAGRVCMDQFVVDVSAIEHVKEGDEVVLVGKQNDAILSVEEVASLAGTINYEIATRLLARVPRRYVRGG